MANDIKSMELYVPYNGTPLSVGGNPVTHIRVSIQHHKKDYNRPARYLISTTPLRKQEWGGWTTMITYGEKQKYDVYQTIELAPRFNQKRIEQLYSEYVPFVKSLIENCVSSDDFATAIINKINGAA